LGGDDVYGLQRWVGKVWHWGERHSDRRDQKKRWSAGSKKMGRDVGGGELQTGSPEDLSTTDLGRRTGGEFIAVLVNVIVLRKKRKSQGIFSLPC